MKGLKERLPIHALFTLPYLIISSEMLKILSDGIAKPTPSEPPDNVAIEVLILLIFPLNLLGHPQNFLYL